MTTYRLTDEARFFLIYPNGEEVQVQIRNNSLEFEDAYNKDYGFEVKSLDTNIVFYDDGENLTFQKIYQFDKNNFNCLSLKFRIEAYYDDAWHFFWLGLLELHGAEWDHDSNTVSIKMATDDIFTCILQNHRIKKNLLDIVERVSVDTIVGEIECREVVVKYLPEDGQIANESPSPPDGAAWGLTFSESTFTQSLTIFIDSGREVEFRDVSREITAQFCREIWTESDPPSLSEGWIQDGDQYVRQLPLSSVKESRSVANLPNTFIEGDTELHVRRVTTTIMENEPIDYEADNLLTLESVMNFLTADCGVTWKSDFFGWDPDNTHPSNGAYAYALDHYQNILMSQASDIIRADARNNATKMIFDFETIFKSLKAVFNVEILKDGDQLRIEHISFSSFNQNIDLTTDANRHFLRRKNKLSKESLDFPVIEEFNFKYPTGSPDFDDAEILYPATCSNDDPKKYDAPNCVTNIGYLYNNRNLIDDFDKMEDTFCLIASSNGSVSTAVGAISGIHLLNGSLAFSNIVERLYIYERPQRRAMVNGKNMIFDSVIRLDEQKDLSIEMNLKDYATNFSLSEMMKTLFGWGEVRSAKYEMPFQKLDFSLFHE